MKREVIEVPVISEAIRRLGAPTSALVRAGDLLFTCGMPPIDVRTGDIVQGDIATQTRAALDALEATLSFGGSSMSQAVKTIVFITDPALMGEVNAIYRERFPDGFPARTSAGIKAWPAPFDIEIECVAVIP
jgi:enamine deaminase RidA (YjgF/YER057c/UK114 family)